LSNSNTIEISIEVTELEHMKKWFFEVIPEFSATEGFYTEFEITHENRSFRHCWRVIEVVPQTHYIPEFKRQSSLDGWTYIMKEMLGPYLAELNK